MSREYIKYDHTKPPEITSTLRQIARAIDDGEMGIPNTNWLMWAADEIERLREAIEAEREACAKVAESLTEKSRWARHAMSATPIEPCHIATAIRARKTP